MYLLKLAIRPFRRSTVSMLLYAFTFGGIAFLLSALAWMEIQVLPHVLHKVNEERAIVFLSNAVSDADLDALAHRVEEIVGLQVRVVDRKSALSVLSDAYPDMAQEMKDLGTLEASLIPRYFLIQGALNESDLKSLGGIEGLERVQTLGVRKHEWVTALSRSLWLLDFVKIALGTLLFTLLVLLIRLFQVSFQDYRSIAILMGGGGIASVAPNLISGALWGVAASGVAAVGAWLMEGSLVLWKQWLPEAQIEPFLKSWFGLALLLGCFAVGTGAGWLSRNR